MSSLSRVIPDLRSSDGEFVTLRLALSQRSRLRNRASLTQVIPWGASERGAFRWKILQATDPDTVKSFPYSTDSHLGSFRVLT
jgi:hypothetical protein